MSADSQDLNRGRGHSRRVFLRSALLVSAASLVAACTPSAPPVPTAAPTAVPAAKPTEVPKPTVASTAPTVAAKPAGVSLSDLAALAKKEGKLVIAGPPDAPLREALLKFNQVYSDISIEYTGGGGRDHGPRILAERDAGRYLWDVLVGGAGTAFRTMKPKGMFDPLKPALTSDVQQDSAWISGFDFGFQDIEKQFVYAFEGTVKPVIWVNRDIVPDSELNKIDQILDAKWKGKIVSEDPRVSGAGISDAAHLLALKGEDFLKKLWAHEVTFMTDRRLLPESIVRGTHPIGTGLTATDFKPFQEQGLGKNIKGLEMDGPGARAGSFWGCCALINKAPNPNAAKLFVNWLLSRDGQSTWVAATLGASRRTDVVAADDIKMRVTTKWTDDEPNGVTQDKAAALAKDLIK